MQKNSEMTRIDFNRGRTDYVDCPLVQSISFDRCGEAFAAGSNDGLVSLFDVTKGKRLRNLNLHTDSITAISWNRSFSLPYILATGSRD